jgi:hypothetical protein
MSGLDKITFSPIRDKPRDKETTKQFVKDIDKGMYSYAINTGFYGPGIVALRANPEMLEFILIDGTRTIIVHSPVGYIFQNFNAEQVCRETDFVVGLLNACFNVKNSDNDKIGEHVNVVTSDNVLKMCNEAEVRKEETPIFTNPSPFSSIHYEEAASTPGAHVGASIDITANPIINMRVKLITNASIIRIRVRVHMPSANIKNIRIGGGSRLLTY